MVQRGEKRQWEERKHQMEKRHQGRDDSRARASAPVRGTPRQAKWGSRARRTIGSTQTGRHVRRALRKQYTNAVNSVSNVLLRRTSLDELHDKVVIEVSSACVSLCTCSSQSPPDLSRLVRTNGARSPIEKYLVFAAVFFHREAFTASSPPAPPRTPPQRRRALYGLPPGASLMVVTPCCIAPASSQHLPTRGTPRAFAPLRLAQCRSTATRFLPRPSRFCDVPLLAAWPCSTCRPAPLLVAPPHEPPRPRHP